MEVAAALLWWCGVVFARLWRDVFMVSFWWCGGVYFCCGGFVSLWLYFVCSGGAILWCSS